MIFLCDKNNQKEDLNYINLQFKKGKVRVLSTDTRAITFSDWLDCDSDFEGVIFITEALKKFVNISFIGGVLTIDGKKFNYKKGSLDFDMVLNFENKLGSFKIESEAFYHCEIVDRMLFIKNNKITNRFYTEEYADKFEYESEFNIPFNLEIEVVNISKLHKVADVIEFEVYSRGIDSNGYHQGVLVAKIKDFNFAIVCNYIEVL